MKLLLILLSLVFLPVIMAGFLFGLARGFFLGAFDAADDWAARAADGD